MKIRVADIVRNRAEVLALGEVQGDWLVIPDERRKDYERLFRRLRGLGDAVEVFARPVAISIDWLTGTNLQGCGGCAERKEALNAAVPFGLKAEQERTTKE